MECDVVFFSDRKSLKILSVLSVEVLPFEIKQQHQRKEERCVTTQKRLLNRLLAVNEHPTYHVCHNHRTSSNKADRKFALPAGRGS